jgi:cytochrome c oxidase cbb3-type subunit 1
LCSAVVILVSLFLQQSEIMTITKENSYNYRVVRQFSVMAVVWGIVGMLVGVVIATQLAFPEFLTGIPWLSYGRLRPLHTNAVIFAFGGCALMATSYYVVQRTSNVRLFSDGLAEFTFWGWQLVIVAAAVLCLWVLLRVKNTLNWNGQLIC